MKGTNGRFSSWQGESMDPDIREWYCISHEKGSRLERDVKEFLEEFLSF